MQMQNDQIFQAYFDALAASGKGACAAYLDFFSWTPIATGALVQAGRSVIAGGTSTAKGYKDQYGRSEYMTLDVVIADPKTWGPPIFIAEHENWVSRERLQYQAWKLLSIDASFRMLVGYFGVKTLIPTFEDLVTLVQAVCADNLGKEILLAGGDYNAAPKRTADFRKIYTTAVVSGPRRGNSRKMRAAAEGT